MADVVEGLVVPGAPAPQGPYSSAVRAGDFLYLSGQGPADPLTGRIVETDIRRQTEAVLANLLRVLEGCGAGRTDVVKSSVYLASADDFSAMNEIYAAFFGTHRPARTTVQVGMVDPDMKVEIDFVAYVPTGTK